MTDRCRRFNDRQAHDQATRLLRSLLGRDHAERVCWDPEHHLQGHLDVAGAHLVVIAPRDDHHVPLLLSEVEWDALRHGAGAASDRRPSAQSTDGSAASGSMP